MNAPLTLHSLPLFPLGTVLYPGGLLPLRIFEVRYLDMIRRCHAAGTPFGVVSLTQGHEVRQAGAPQEAFCEIGTLATLAEVQARYADGLGGRLPDAEPKFEGDGHGVERNRFHIEAVGVGGAVKVTVHESGEPSGCEGQREPLAGIGVVGANLMRHHG